jgi:hypothetical protein
MREAVRLEAEPGASYTNLIPPSTVPTGVESRNAVEAVISAS